MNDKGGTFYYVNSSRKIEGSMHCSTMGVNTANKIVKRANPFHSKTRNKKRHQRFSIILHAWAVKFLLPSSFPTGKFEIRFFEVCLSELNRTMAGVANLLWETLVKSKFNVWHHSTTVAVALEKVQGVPLKAFFNSYFQY